MVNVQMILDSISEKVEWIEPYLYQDSIFGPDGLPCEKIHLPDYGELFRECIADFKDYDSFAHPYPNLSSIIEVVYDREEDKFDVIVYHFEEEVFWMANDTYDF